MSESPQRPGAKKAGRRRRRPQRTAADSQQLAGRALQAVDQLVEELVRQARQEIHGAPLKELFLELNIPLGSSRPSLTDRARRLDEELGTRVREALLAHAAFQLGQVYCLRCESSRCNHSAPPESAAIFRGYGQTGRPEWTGLADLLTQRSDPRIDRLTGEESGRVALTMSFEELYEELLPGFEGPRQRFFILGQICAGPFHVGPDRQPAALTLQVARVEDGSPRGNLAVNLVTSAIADPANSRHFPGVAGAVRSLRRELAALPRSFAKRVVPKEGVPLQRLAKRCHRLLRDVARDLEHRSRSDQRRTQHARERSEERTRPTSKAFEDALRASDERLLEDRREHTIVVLGPRSRVHFFTADGKHVTSVVYPGHVVKGRTTQKRWTPLEKSAAASFRLQLDRQGAPSS
jgi:hypothetical protein